MEERPFLVLRPFLIPACDERTRRKANPMRNGKEAGPWLMVGWLLIGLFGSLPFHSQEKETVGKNGQMERMIVARALTHVSIDREREGKGGEEKDSHRTFRLLRFVVPAPQTVPSCWSFGRFARSSRAHSVSAARAIDWERTKGTWQAAAAAKRSTLARRARRPSSSSRSGYGTITVSLLLSWVVPTVVFRVVCGD